MGEPQLYLIPLRPEVVVLAELGDQAAKSPPLGITEMPAPLSLEKTVPQGTVLAVAVAVVAATELNSTTPPQAVAVADSMAAVQVALVASQRLLLWGRDHPVPMAEPILVAVAVAVAVAPPLAQRTAPVAPAALVAPVLSSCASTRRWRDELRTDRKWDRDQHHLAV